MKSKKENEDLIWDQSRVRHTNVIHWAVGFTVWNIEVWAANSRSGSHQPTDSIGELHEIEDLDSLKEA